MDLNKLRDWAKSQGVGLIIVYSESCVNAYSIEVMSTVGYQEYCEKNVLNVESFIHNWEKHVEKGMWL